MKWTWPYILQQVVVLGAWGWLMRAVWREVRGFWGGRAPSAGRERTS